MALVRVYCGLAMAESTARSASTGPALTSAVVDDAGRLIHVCEISDDPAGYAWLGALLADRSSGPSGVAVAADSDDHVVVSLLSAAGRPLAIADDDSVDDFAERFADDESLEEMQSPPEERRAVGLARALQAGALSAVMLPPPRDLGAYKPVLAAHAALASGRHSAAVALREVLRELYPAALRAYPDPADPVSLAVLDALPEPGMVAGTGSRRDASLATEGIVAHLAGDGIAEPATIGDAITALRVAIAETPRRAPVSKGVTAAAAETVRQAVAAVRACDAGCDALVAALAERVSNPAPAVPTRAGRRAALVDQSSPTPAAERRAQPRQPDHEPVPAVGRRRQLTPSGGTGPATSPRPVAPPPVAPAPVAPPPLAPRPIAPAASAGSGPSVLPTRPSPARAAEPSPIPASLHRTDPSNRPVSAPPPPPPGITPIPPSQRGSRPPAESGEPFRATLTTAAINSARAERQRPTPIPPRPKTRQDEAARPTSNGFGATDLSLPMPAPRPAAEPPAAPPGSRANWPLVNSTDDLADRGSAADKTSHPFDERDAGAGRRSANGSGAGSRVTPPWLADDLPQEPPMLRLVEPPPLADRALREDPRRQEPIDETPPLRLVEREARPELATRSRRAVDDTQSEPPVSDDGDGDLLIFAAARSAWFTGHAEESDDEIEWTSTADTGWRAAEQAARPAVGIETGAGLPKRVPQANLVPGSPLREERPLRIVRNAASLAENTTGYFRGWRRGQEIGGYAVGGRPGREAAGGWDFSRDPGEPEELDYEYGSAGYRR